jgi:oligopeptide transport system substrate-binding protein
VRKLLVMKNVLICISLLFLLGCGSSSEDMKNVFRMNMEGGDPATLDPRQMRMLNDMNLANMMYEGLMRLDQNGEVSFGVAENYEVSEDGKAYIFSLRKSKWSDGTPITAYDFEYSWKRMLDPNFLAPCVNSLYVIKNAQKAKEDGKDIDEVGIEVIDEYTLKVVLENPTNYFLKLTTMVSYFPIKKGLDEEDPDWFYYGKGTVSNGPFVLERWKSNDYIKLVKNPRYWQKRKIRLEGVKIYMLEPSTELQMFERGDLEWAGSPMSTLPSDALQNLKGNENLNIVSALGTHFYRFNVEKYPFNNANIRKAFAYAIDRKAITDNVLQAGQIPATRLIPPSLSSVGQADYDLDKATEYFSLGLYELGIIKEKFPEVILLYATNERNHKIAQAIQQQWQDVLGVTVILENTESKVFLERRKNVDYMVANSSWIGDFSDPINFLDVFKYKDNGLNNTNWESAKYIALLDRSERGEKRGLYLEEAEAVLLDDMPIAPIFYYSFCYLKQPYVEGAFISYHQMLELRWAFLSRQHD